MMKAGGIPMTTRMAGLLFLGAAAVGCGGNTSGDLAAQNVGDVSNPLRERTDAFTEIDAACSLTSVRGGERSILRRRPYLQRLGTTATDILWTADAGMLAPQVVVTTPDGREVTRVPGTVDPSARPPEGATLWKASVQGLQPDTVYCYDLGAEGSSLRRSGFRTAPLAGPDARPVRILAFGDSGDGSADQAAVTAQLRTVPFEVAIHMGDLAYGVGSREEIERNFFRAYGDMLESFAVFPASGNHEYLTEAAAPFREAFHLPDNGGPEGNERWYSFDWGNVHFVALDTELVGDTQAAWLDADLAANKLPWTVVYLHRPPFSSGEHGSTANVQQVFVPLFEKHRVPLVLAGHDHDYERTHPQNGVTYVVTGGGGVGTRPVGVSSFTAFSEAVCHFLYLTVDSNQLTMHAIDGTGVEFDSLVLRR